MKIRGIKLFAHIGLAIALFQFSPWTSSWGQSIDLCRAVGQGVIPQDPTKTPEELREMAERTAWIVAMRNLGEQIMGVRVDAKSTVQDYAVSSDRIRTQIKAMVQRARVVETKYLKDGTVEVILETDCNKIPEMISKGK